MKRYIAALLLFLVPSVSWAECGNATFNIIRATECQAYTSDYGKLKDLRDVRINAIQEFTDKDRGGGNTLFTILSEANATYSTAMGRPDLALWPDKSMWESRGCAILPICGNKGSFVTPTKKADPEPAAEEGPAFEPKPAKPARRKPRNSRTGGDYCGPKDTASGYCD